MKKVERNKENKIKYKEEKNKDKNKRGKNKMKKLLLIGISDFKKLREGGYVYVDKTEYIYRLILS